MKIDKTLIIFVVTFVILSIILKSLIPILFGVIFLGIKFLYVKNEELAIKKKAKQSLEKDFHLYLKNVILLLYTRPLKQAFIDANYIDNPVLKTHIEKFIEKQKFDFSIKPYTELAFDINPETEFVNYELNIMQLLFETNKRGLGNEYINDLLTEIDMLITNEMQMQVERINNEAYLYSLPPTVINFIYVSFVLFKVIDEMIMSVLL